MNNLCLTEFCGKPGEHLCTFLETGLFLWRIPMYLVYFSHLVERSAIDLIVLKSMPDTFAHQSQRHHCIFIWHIKESEKCVSHAFRSHSQNPCELSLSGGVKLTSYSVATFSLITAAVILERVTLQTRMRSFLSNEREEIETMAGNVIENQQHKKGWRERCSQIYPSLSLQHHPKTLQEWLLYFGLMKTQAVVPVKSSLLVFSIAGTISEWTVLFTQNNEPFLGTRRRKYCQQWVKLQYNILATCPQISALSNLSTFYMLLAPWEAMTKWILCHTVIWRPWCL